MENYAWGHHRRFNAYANYFKQKFGKRIQKLSIDAGFTCPNRDGTIARGGCTYCNNKAFSPSYCSTGISVQQQIEEGITFHKERYGADQFLAYFQSYTNTYTSLDKLKEVYEPALQHKDIVGIVIGTRPDCIDDEKLAYFQTLSQQKYLTIEYGIESTYDETLQRINRGHTFEQTKEAIEKTASYGLNVGGHLIVGLPGETREMMMDQVSVLNALPLTTIKFHQLQIIKDTVMARQYKENPDAFRLFEMKEYIDFIIDIVERLNPDFIIERFSAEAPPRFNLSKSWGVRSADLISMIEQRMKERHTFQGKFLNNQKKAMTQDEIKTIPAFDYFKDGDKEEKIRKLAPYIIGDNLKNPMNHGALIRLGSNIGAQKVFFTQNPDELSITKVKKTAGSSHTHMDFEFLEWEEIMKEIPEDYVWIAIETSSRAKMLYEQVLPEKCVFVVGNESYGLPKERLRQCHQHIYIPMPGNTKSMNVSHAATVVAFEWVRQQLL